MGVSSKCCGIMGGMINGSEGEVFLRGIRLGRKMFMWWIWGEFFVCMMVIMRKVRLERLGKWFKIDYFGDNLFEGSSVVKVIKVEVMFMKFICWNVLRDF